MRPAFLTSFFAAALLALPGAAAPLNAPKRDFTIELRQMEDRETSGYTVGTQPRTPMLVAQKVSVRNGEKATLRLNVDVPVQWVQKLEAQSSSQTTGTGITNAVTWMEAGQSVVVTPHWPGGKQPVMVEIDIQTASLEERTGAQLPDQTRTQTATMVSAPLGEWVTVATQGQQRGNRGSYSSSAAAEVPRIIQLRVNLN